MRRKQTRLLTGIEGFSLIEIVLVLVLIGIMAGVLIPTLELGVKSYTASETRVDLASQARQAATRMIRELRNVQKEANNTPNITAADATSITFVDVLDNTITFSLSSGTVQRNSNPLVAVSTLQFRYFSGNNTELTSLPLSAANRDNVRRIMVTLTLTETSQTVSVIEQVFLRELSGL